MEQMPQMDFKARKFIQHAKQQDYNKHSNDADLDTFEKIDSKFNDYCSVFEKQFDQILSKGGTKNIQDPKRRQSSQKGFKSQSQSDNAYLKQQTLKNQISGILLNGSVENGLEQDIKKNLNNKNDKLQSQKSGIMSKHGSMPQMNSPNFIIKKNTREFSKQSSIKSFSNIEGVDNQTSPLKVNKQTKQDSFVPMAQETSSSLIQRPSTSTGQALIIKPEQSIYSCIQSTEGNKNTKGAFTKQEDQIYFKISESRKNLMLQSPGKSINKKVNQNSPNKILSKDSSQNKLISGTNQKTVKFTNQNPQINSLQNIDEVQDNLVRIGIGSLMLEQLRLSQIDLNKVEDINSFSDRQSLLSSKILKEFGIGQAQVIGFKKESEKQEFIKKTINSSVNSLYKKWFKAYEERMDKIENMEEEYEELKEKNNRREKLDFEWINVETKYKALENELKQLIVKKLNDYETQTYILDNMMPEKNLKQIQELAKGQSSSMSNLQVKKNSIDSKDYGGSLTNGLESPPQSPLQRDSNSKMFNTQNNYSIKVIDNQEVNNKNEQKKNYKEITPRKESIDLSKNHNNQVKQIFNQPLSSRGGERQSHVASTVLHTDYSNITDVNTSITKQSGRKGLSSQFDTQTNYTFRKSFNQSATNLSSYPYNAEESIIFSTEKQRNNFIERLELQPLQEEYQQIQKGGNRVTNKDGKKYVYGENTYVKEEILDENLSNKITEYVDKSDQIRELGERLSQQIDWKIELDSVFVELRKENRKKNNNISKGNNMNLITFFPIMQDVFKNLKSDRNKEKLMERYREGEILTNEQLSFLASTNKLLNRFIDRDYLDKGIKFFSNKGIQSHLEYLLAENIIQTYELIKEIIYQHRKNYLFHKNNQLLHEQEMFKQRQEQRVSDLEKAKEKIRMNKRMEAVCRSLDRKIIIKEQERIEQQNRAISTFNKETSKDPISNVAQKFVNNIKKSIIEKQSLRDIFINNISKPKQQIKIEEIKLMKKNNQQKQKLLDKIATNEGADILSRLTNKAMYEDDPKNKIRQSYHPSSKLFVEDHRDEYKQITPQERKMADHEIKRFKRKFNQSKAQDQEDNEKEAFTKYYTGGPLQSSYINSKYYGERQIHTIIRVQAVARGYLARKILKKLKEKKKREIEIRRRAEKTREKQLLKERIKLELFSPRSLIDKLTPKSKKSGDGSPKVGFTEAIQSKKIKKKSRFSKPIQRKSILTSSHFDLAMQNEMKLNYHRKVILNQDVSNRFQKLIGAAKNNNFAYIEKGKFQFFTIDVNKVDEFKNSALYYAARHGNILFCQYLIELGADVNQVCQYGNTPFHMACQSNNKNLIMLFQQAGSNLDKPNYEGLTPLSFASFDILSQLDAMKIISLRDNNCKQQFKNIKIFKRGIPESEFKAPLIEYDPSHLFAQFPSQQGQNQQQKQ